jgi:alpha-tubulin suppressor-like RCC1 family protein
MRLVLEMVLGVFLGVGCGPTREDASEPEQGGVSVREARLSSVVLGTVSTGDTHSLVVRSDGTVWASGDNLDGQLGDGTTNDHPSPVQVPGLSGVKAVAAGAFHSLAVREDGTVWAWGSSSFGQIGDGTTAPRRLSPVQVPGLSGVVAVAAGHSFSLALREDGTVWGWGQNSSGQLGDGTTTHRFAPVQASGLSGVKAVASGMGHALAVRADGSVWTWGYNAYGQLGVGTFFDNRLVPTQTNLSGVVAVAGGYSHSLALGSDGTVWAWGYNANGQLGDGTTHWRAVPGKVPGLSGVVAVTAGTHHSVTLQSDGTLRSWGFNSNGQLGDGSMTQRLVPAQVPGLMGVRAVEAGGHQVLAVREDGSVWGWGYNVYGQLGNGQSGQQMVPVQVSGSSASVAMEGGALHSLAVHADGTVWAWGSNPFGSLGDGTTTSRAAPVQVPGLSGMVAVAGGSNHSLALGSDGTVWAWGYNASGQLGDGTTLQRLVPVQVPGLSGVVAVASGNNHSLALGPDGTVWAWGSNGGGQLGDGTTTQRLVPVQVPGLSGVVAVAAGGDNSLAVRSDGTVWGWGRNSFGALGDGTTTQRLVPVQLAGLSGVVAVSVGQYHGVALRSDGTVWSWGFRLGQGASSSSSMPAQVAGLSGASAIASGDDHSVVLLLDGTVWAWGHNNVGPLGDGSTTQRPAPVRMTGVSDAVAVAAGGAHTLVRRADGTLWAVGKNDEGQLGDGGPGPRVLSPAPGWEQVCSASDSCVPVCRPNTCVLKSKNCGPLPDGCGGMRQCGACEGVDLCVDNVCAAPPASGGMAAYDSALGVPHCSVPRASCDSGLLLHGRGEVGPESAAPNTLNGSCQDGSSGTYRVDGSLERLRVVSVDGTPLQAGRPVRVEATVWAASSDSTPGYRLELSYAENASQPVWKPLGTLRPSVSGQQTLAATYTLPAGTLHLVRGAFFPGTGALSCTSAPGFQDVDDLAFVVMDPPPSVGILSPAQGALVRGSVTFSASASDNVAVRQVGFYAGSQHLGTLTAPPYQVSWNSLAVPNGPVTLRARAEDAAGQVTETMVDVTVDNDMVPPQVTLTSPVNGQTVQGSVTLGATASDNRGVVRVEFFTGSRFIAADTTAPFSVVWNTAVEAAGSHSLTAFAYDAAGNFTRSAAVEVTVSAVSPPQVPVAVYDSYVRTPVCYASGVGCDSGVLLDGRAGLGPERNAPNTLVGSVCADGTAGGYHSDESLDRLLIRSVDGTPMRQGRAVVVEATVWAWAGGGSDVLDLYYTSDAFNPSWTFLTTLTPQGSGMQKLNATYTLPMGSGVQAIRGVFRYGGMRSTCTGGTYDDHDDLVFIVNMP